MLTRFVVVLFLFVVVVVNMYVFKNLKMFHWTETKRYDLVQLYILSSLFAQFVLHRTPLTHMIFNKCLNLCNESFEARSEDFLTFDPFFFLVLFSGTFFVSRVHICIACASILCHVCFLAIKLNFEWFSGDVVDDGNYQFTLSVPCRLSSIFRLM